MPTVLVTGSNRGLGLEFVRQYAADGWDVIACCRTPSSAKDLQKLSAANSKIRLEALEASDQASIDALVQKLGNTAIDVLINNAGIYSGSPKAKGFDDASQDFGTIEADAWLKVLTVNTIAPIMVTQALAPLVAKSKQRKIINITSRMGSIADTSGGHIAYRSSKAALNMAMTAIKNDLIAQGIIIANLHPGWVQTDMGGKGADIMPQASIAGMRQVIATLSPKDTGTFYDYKGDILPW